MKLFKSFTERKEKKTAQKIAENKRKSDASLVGSGNELEQVSSKLDSLAPVPAYEGEQRPVINVCEVASAEDGAPEMKSLDLPEDTGIKNDYPCSDFNYSALSFADMSDRSAPRSRSLMALQERLEQTSPQASTEIATLQLDEPHLTAGSTSQIPPIVMPTPFCLSDSDFTDHDTESFANLRFSMDSDMRPTCGAKWTRATVDGSNLPDVSHLPELSQSGSSATIESISEGDLPPMALRSMASAPCLRRTPVRDDTPPIKRRKTGPPKFELVAPLPAPRVVSLTHIKDNETISKPDLKHRADGWAKRPEDAELAKLEGHNRVDLPQVFSSSERVVPVNVEELGEIGALRVVSGSRPLTTVNLRSTKASHTSDLVWLPPGTVPVYSIQRPEHSASGMQMQPQVQLMGPLRRSTPAPPSGTVTFGKSPELIASPKTICERAGSSPVPGLTYMHNTIRPTIGCSHPPPDAPLYDSINDPAGDNMTNADGLKLLRHGMFPVPGRSLKCRHPKPQSYAARLAIISDPRSMQSERSSVLSNEFQWTPPTPTVEMYTRRARINTFRESLQQERESSARAMATAQDEYRMAMLQRQWHEQVHLQQNQWNRYLRDQVAYSRMQSRDMEAIHRRALRRMHASVGMDVPEGWGKI